MCRSPSRQAPHSRAREATHRLRGLANPSWNAQIQSLRNRLPPMSWFSIEFGLLEEEGETRIFGAGIHSSTVEIPFSLSADVKRWPSVTDGVIETDYDPSLGRT